MQCAMFILLTLNFDLVLIKTFILNDTISVIWDGRNFCNLSKILITARHKLKCKFKKHNTRLTNIYRKNLRLTFVTFTIATKFI